MLFCSTPLLRMNLLHLGWRFDLLLDRVLNFGLFNLGSSSTAKHVSEHTSESAAVHGCRENTVRDCWRVSRQTLGDGRHRVRSTFARLGRCGLVAAQEIANASQQDALW